MEGPWEGVSPTPEPDKALGLLRCKSAILDMVEPGEPHSQPSAAVTIATRGGLGKKDPLLGQGGSQSLSRAEQGSLIRGAGCKRQDTRGR